MNATVERKNQTEWQIAALGGQLTSLTDYKVKAQFPFGEVEFAIDPLMKPEQIGNLFFHEIENQIFLA